MIILVLFVLIPVALGVLVEYVVCRAARRIWWKGVPPVLAALLVAAVAVFRYRVWSSQVPPWTQLIFLPGLPGACLFLGLFLGWRIWRRRWRPRVIRDKFQKP